MLQILIAGARGGVILLGFGEAEGSGVQLRSEFMPSRLNSTVKVLKHRFGACVVELINSNLQEPSGRFFVRRERQRDSFRGKVPQLLPVAERKAEVAS